MVSHPGRTTDTRRIRRLKSPRALEVEAAEDGTPLRRDYYEVAPEDGPPVTVYHDQVSGEWARQAY